LKLRITIAGNIYEAEVEVLDEESAPAYAPLPAYVPAPSVPAFSSVESTSNHDAVDKVCRSPVTGLVIRVHVEAGQAVEEGQVLMVLEAMKMETQVAAPCVGTVQKVHVAPGNSVKMSQVLVELV
jgi:methylmalonyl-CoA carboxyltransferase small subunit